MEWAEWAGCSGRQGFKSINYGNAYVECMERSWDEFPIKLLRLL